MVRRRVKMCSSCPRWFVGRGLDPSGSVGGDGNGQRANNVRPYRMCTLICKVQRPRCPVRSLCCRPMRADIESAPTVIVAQLPCGRRGRFYIGPSRASALGGQSDGRHPAKPARSCGSMPHRGIDRCATPQRRPLRVILMLVAKVATPQSPSVTAPLGGEPLRADDEHRPLQYGRRGI